jgi:hypothetical protein
MKNTTDGAESPTTSGALLSSKASKRPAHCRNGRFGCVPLEWVPHLRGPRLAVFVVLCAYADLQGKCHPSIPTIALKAKMDRRDVQKALRALEDAQAIRTTERNDQTSVYQLLTRKEGAG